VILIIGIAILYYAYPPKAKNYYDTDRLSEDVIGVLMATNITDLCIKPGTNVSSGCKCQNYPRLQVLVCNERMMNKNPDMLSFMTELIETRRAQTSSINDMIHEMFIDKNVIDEKRFGLAIIYTKPSPNSTTGDKTYELYNTGG